MLKELQQMQHRLQMMMLHLTTEKSLPVRDTIKGVIDIPGFHFLMQAEAAIIGCMAHFVSRPSTTIDELIIQPEKQSSIVFQTDFKRTGVDTATVTICESTYSIKGVMSDLDVLEEFFAKLRK